MPSHNRAGVRRVVSASLATVPVMILALSSSVSAQDERVPFDVERRLEEMSRSYEVRIARLEAEIGALRMELESGASGDRSELEQAVDSLAADVGAHGVAGCGHAQHEAGRHDLAIGFVSDFILSSSTRQSSGGALDRFHLRGVELELVGRVDEAFAYYLFVHLDQDEIELEEAYAVADDWLPCAFTVKLGRFNSDFGKQSPLHEHELPYVDKPGVLQEYLGGSLRGTGVEVHHEHALGDQAIARWSIGALTSPDGDAHAILGPLAGADHHEDEAAIFADRDAENFAYTARFTTAFDVGARSRLQLGASVLWAPEIPLASHDPNGEADDDEDDDVVATKRLVLGIDATFTQHDAGTGEGLTLGAELLWNDASYRNGAGELADETSFGFYAYGEWRFDRRWAVGASVDWFQRAAFDAEWVDAGAFVTWKMDERNQLRGELRYVDDELGDDESITLMLQWVTIIGSHGHGASW